MFEKHFWRKHLCALQVFLCALVSRPVFTHSLEGTLPRDDYRELLEPTVIFLGGVPQRGIKFYESRSYAPFTIYGLFDLWHENLSFGIVHFA